MPGINVDNEISIVLSGEAGQGIQTVEIILTHILKNSGFHVFATKEYMSRVRGGSNSTEIRVSSARVDSYTDRIDLLVALDPDITRLSGRIGKDTLVVGDASKIGKGYNIVDTVFEKLAEPLGSAVYSNIIAVGALLALFGIGTTPLEEYIRKRFGAKSEDILDKNFQAAKIGNTLGTKWRGEGTVGIGFSPRDGLADEILVSGAEAVGLGALAGGCNFVSSYPMSPGSSVLHVLASLSNDFPLIVEQAEDEIAAINMGIGAWYAGARAMVTTSGGGFALMSEGVSLAGMVESPMVIHIGQRPGPATGLPTRTEQGDLDLAMFAGHGDFARAIYAPGSLADAYSLAALAFDTADKYQIPVFILTDQYFLDSYYNIKPFDPKTGMTEPYLEKTDEDYKRYRLTPGGISPRGIPGYGDGFVRADSDEHDEEGRITESAEVRRKMVEKRHARLGPLSENAIPPELIGPSGYETLIVGWGSTRNIVRETLEKLARPKLAFAHFKQVCPLPPSALDILERAKKLILVENNAAGQFGALLRRNHGIEFDHKILQSDGFPFSPENLAVRLEEIIGKGGGK
ncbi:MAG: 2-oxoacid:ferredoxin oxidoreductase subunit alpha [Spirochaetes bacterium GWF1_51_8]|nr:MAG: 2-oxoacid:ferredoxin oxidoreductase subunit alpha [Spirochaetes bacterium GWF1_51_8]